jgi:AcrR family transcriptional regulator
MPNQIARVSPRAARTRAALIAAGFELLSEKPIDAIAIDDVVATARVAKGSFFNHFADKADFATAIATEVRLELETLIGRAKADVADPVARMATGMRVGAKFAITQPKRTTVLLRTQASSTASDHPLNRGLLDDIEAACAEGLLRAEAKDAGVLYWLGLCQVLMMYLIEKKPSRATASRRVREMLVLGLTGLGVSAERAAELGRERTPPYEVNFEID